MRGREKQNCVWSSSRVGGTEGGTGGAHRDRLASIEGCRRPIEDAQDQVSPLRVRRPFVAATYYLLLMEAADTSSGAVPYVCGRGARNRN